MSDTSTIINVTILNHVLKKKVQGLLFRLTRVSSDSLEDIDLKHVLETAVAIHEKQEIILKRIQEER